MKIKKEHIINMTKAANRQFELRDAGKLDI
jgi:hypothetical protein